jgi:hypothetical protein
VGALHTKGVYRAAPRRLIIGAMHDTRNHLHIGILEHDIQQRIVRGETSRLARELRTPRLRGAQIGGYSVPKMRSPASPKPGRM